MEGTFQKETIARNIIKFYEIFQNNSSSISFKQICDKYALANSEVIEREKQLADRISEIQNEYQDMGEEQFMSKYAYNPNEI